MNAEQVRDAALRQAAEQGRDGLSPEAAAELAALMAPGYRRWLEKKNETGSPEEAA